MSSLLVLTPLRIEQIALGAVPGARVLRTGMGPARARIAAARAQADTASCVAVAGLCAGAGPELRTGDVVCAIVVIGDDGVRVGVPASDQLAEGLRRRGFHVHLGALYSASRILGPDERRALAPEILGVDMESAWLASGSAGRPFAVARVVVDEAGRRLADPRMAIAGPRALRALRRLGGGLAEWASTAAAPGPEADRAAAGDVLPAEPSEPLPAASRGDGC
jgi:4-hydroxy-3-methylbut-2-enyl diphosphate reductase